MAINASRYGRDTWQEKLTALLQKNDSSGPSEMEEFPYHSEEVITFVRNLEWDGPNGIKKQHFERLAKIQKTLHTELRKLHVVCVQIIFDYCKPLFEGNWYTSGELFIQFFNEIQFVGCFFGYIVVGQLSPENDYSIWFHQYPSNFQRCVKFKQRVTVTASLSDFNDQLIAMYILGKRAPWRELSIVRRPPLFQEALIFAAEGNVEGLQKCFQSGYDINYRFDQFQKSTVLDIATVHNQPEMVEYLLNRGADASIKNDSGSTPLGIARAKDYFEVVQIFEQFDIVK